MKMNNFTVKTHTDCYG